MPRSVYQSLMRCPRLRAEGVNVPPRFTDGVSHGASRFRPGTTE
jgi:hypothetical protein